LFTKQGFFMNQAKPTIRTVAHHVQLSPTTVSLALRGDPSIPEETRLRVVEAARTLNYDYASRTRVRAPVAEATRRLAYVVKDYGDQPANTNPFYGRILQGVQSAWQAENGSVSFVVLAHNHPRSRALPVGLNDVFDGIIMSSPYPQHVIDRVAEYCSCPIVLVDNMIAGLPYDAVMSDDFGGAYMITRHLLHLGHAHIKPIMGSTRNLSVPPSFWERNRGYRAACHEAGVKPLEPAIVPQEIDHHNGGDLNLNDMYVNWVQQLLKATPEITAFFGASDLYAIWVMRSLERLGYDVPAQFSVVGYDDDDLSSVVHPALTTVHAFKRRIGEIAVRQVLGRMNGDDSPPSLINVGTRLILRDSTARL
jgi:LacI family transcriptional regulator